MRNLILAFLALTICKASGQANEKSTTETNSKASADTIVIGQMDGSRLHVICTGDIFLSYCETIDGYTVVLDDVGIYEYAKLTSGGDLKPMDFNAKDPEKRTRKERHALKKIPKHLRYSAEKLEKIEAKKKKFDNEARPMKDKLKLKDSH